MASVDAKSSREISSQNQKVANLLLYVGQEIIIHECLNSANFAKLLRDNVN